MSSRRSTPDPEILLAQSDWMRALARRLVADTHGAEDVTQSAWLAALSEPWSDDSGVPGLRAWLARTVRHLAHRRARSESSRTDREKSVARREAQSSTADLVEREAARQEIVAALLELHEPYRSALVLHFFDDLPAHEIARLQGVPGSTVRTRIQRGLAMLRERLERERGDDWRAMCVNMLPLASAARVVPVATAAKSSSSSWLGGLVVGSKLKVALVVALLSLAGFLAWNPMKQPLEPEAEHALARTEAPLAREELTKPVEIASASSRTPLDAKDTQIAVAEEPAPSGLVLTGTCSAVDGTRLPEGIVVFIADSNGEEWSDIPIGDRWWIGNVKPGHGMLEGRANGYDTQRIPVVLPAADNPQVFDLRLKRTGAVRVRIESPSGASLRDVDWKVGSEFSPGLIVFATRDVPPDRLPVSFWFDVQRTSLARWEPWKGNSFDGVLIFQGPVSAYVSVATPSVVLETKRVEIGTDELVFEIAPERVRQCFGSLRGRIVDTDTGAALSDAWIHFEDRNSIMETDVEADGSFVWVAAGTERMTVHATDHEMLVREIMIEPGKTTDLGEIRVDAALSLKGRVIDPDGKGVPAKLCATDLARFHGNRSFDDHTAWACKADGSFQPAWLGRHAYLVRVDYGDTRSRPLRVDLSKGPIGNVVIHLERTTQVSLRPTAAPEWDEWIAIDDGELRVLDKPVFDATPITVLLVPGSYTLRHLRGEKLLGQRTIVVSGAPAELDLP